MRTTILLLVLVASCAFAPAAPPASPPQIDIFVQKDKSTRLSGMDYDDKSQDFKFSVHVRNKELHKTFEKLKATLVVTGKDTTHDMFTILDRQESSFDLPLQADHVFSGKTVALSFDDNKYAKYGIKYDGYAVVIEDKDGKVVISKASRTSLLKNFEKIRGMSIDSLFDSKFMPMPGVRPVSVPLP